MRKVIVQEFTSIDGFAAGSNGSIDFIPSCTQGDRSFGARQLGFMESVGTILLGRVTYTLFSGYWPNVTSGDDRPVADRINAIPKVVFSTSLERAPWGSWSVARVSRDVAREVAGLKQEHGKDIVVWGSLTLAESLASDRLIDEYQLVLCPVVLGTGRRLFRADAPAPQVKLLSSMSFDRGAVLLTYAAGSSSSSTTGASRLRRHQRALRRA